MAPFPTIIDGIALQDIRNAWGGHATGALAGAALWMDEATLLAFSTAWGIPEPGAIHVAAAGDLVESVWAGAPAWAIIPFEELEPRWKVISVDGQSPIQYHLIQPFTL